MKQDIRHYSDSELSLVVMNDETFYRFVTRASATPRAITEMVDELFVYTDEQLADLLQTVLDDREENIEAN